MKTPPRGFVLVSVLWVVALLTIITISYHHRARMEVRAARYSLDTSQARMTTRAIVEHAMLTLRNKTAFALLKGGPEQADYSQVAHLGQAWAEKTDLYRENGLLSVASEFENDVATYVIEDLERFININTVSEDVMADLPGISLPVLRRINFRRDGTGDPDAPPHRFTHLAELHAIRGLDDDAWYGEGEETGLRDILTTYGDGKINVNTAPREVLESLLGASSAVAEDILLARNGPDGESNTADDIGFTNWDQFSNATGVNGEVLTTLRQLCKFNSNYFRIKAVATRRAGMIQSHCSAIVVVQGGNSAANVLSWSEESLGSQ